MSQLHAEFDMNDLGILHYFQELHIDYTQHGLFVHQTKYIKDILTKTQMLDYKPYITPCHSHQQLLNSGRVLLLDPAHFRILSAPYST